LLRKNGGSGAGPFVQTDDSVVQTVESVALWGGDIHNITQTTQNTGNIDCNDDGNNHNYITSGPQIDNNNLKLQNSSNKSIDNIEQIDNEENILSQVSADLHPSHILTGKRASIRDIAYSAALQLVDKESHQYDAIHAVFATPYRLQNHLALTEAHFLHHLASGST
jgi:hypothetical protein